MDKVIFSRQMVTVSQIRGKSYRVDRNSRCGLHRECPPKVQEKDYKVLDYGGRINGT